MLLGTLLALASKWLPGHGVPKYVTLSSHIPLLEFQFLHL